MEVMMWKCARLLCLLVLSGCVSEVERAGRPATVESLIIAASPSLSAALTELGNAYETMHPDVRVKLYFDSGLDLRRTIAGMENSMKGRYFIERGPIHLVAPGGDELIDRLEQKSYVLPGARQPYVEERLVLIVPEALADAPSSFDDLRSGRFRVAIADPVRTQTGRMTKGLLSAMDLSRPLTGKLDVASDPHGVLDHLLNGEADVGIALVHDAVRERQRVRIAAISDAQGYTPIVHSMAMERFCGNRALCADFLRFIQSEAAQTALRRLGFTTPPGLDRPRS